MNKFKIGDIVQVNPMLTKEDVTLLSKSYLFDYHDYLSRRREWGLKCFTVRKTKTDQIAIEGRIGYLLSFYFIKIGKLL